MTNRIAVVVINRSVPGSGIMTGVKRRLFNVLWVLSLLIVVALCAAAYRPFVFVAYARPATPAGQSWWFFSIASKRLWVCDYVFSSNPNRVATAPYVSVTSGFQPEHEFELRLLTSASSDTRGAEILLVRASTGSVPIWQLIVGALLLPSLKVLAWRSSKAIPPGHCRKCGYDLRATPERCPECGAVAG